MPSHNRNEPPSPGDAMLALQKNWSREPPRANSPFSFDPWFILHALYLHTAITESLLDQFQTYAQFSSAAYCPNNTNSQNTPITCPSGSCPKVESAGAISEFEFARHVPAKNHLHLGGAGRTQQPWGQIIVPIGFAPSSSGIRIYRID